MVNRLLLLHLGCLQTLSWNNSNQSVKTQYLEVMHGRTHAKQSISLERISDFKVSILVWPFLALLGVKKIKLGVRFWMLFELQALMSSCNLPVSQIA